MLKLKSGINIRLKLVVFSSKMLKSLDSFVQTHPHLIDEVIAENSEFFLGLNLNWTKISFTNQKVY